MSGEPAPDRRALGALAVGHACADLCQGAVPALVPFLIAERGLSLSQTGALLLVMTVGSSVLQPVFGHVADRRDAAWLAPAGLVLAGGGIAALGLLDGTAAGLLAVGVSGLGVGLFHPEAARSTGRAARARPATGLSVFAVGGNAGFALAPALLTPAVLVWGLPGAAVVLVPVTLAALWLTAVAVRPASVAPPPPRRAAAGAPPDRWGAFAVLGAVASLRSGVYFGLQAFVAVYFVEHLAASPAAGNGALTAMLAAGAAGTLVGGRLADRLRTRVVMVGFLAAVAPLLAAFLLVGDPAAAVVLIACVGFVSVGNFSLTIVMGQSLLPSRPGLASGVTLGLAIGVGGLIAAGLGPVADHAGVEAVLWGLIAVAVLAAALALALPEARAPTRRGAPPEPQPA